MSDSRTLSLKPIIHYPRMAQVGKTYLMTIDLEVGEGFEWQHDEEEYPIYCEVYSDPFSSKPIAEPVIILHRFGGSYGASKFLLTATQQTSDGIVSVRLIDKWGVSIKVFNLDQIRIVDFIEANPISLETLTSLDLRSQRLTTLPELIAQSTNLKTLDLSNSQLTTLPYEIGQLTNLTSLNLQNNQLVTLPESIAQLTNLKTLDLSNNQLTTLPYEIGQLTNLTSLNLSNNQLVTLPESIAQLTNLKTLDLSNNQLIALPDEIGQLTKLQILSLESNSLSEIPPEIVKQGGLTVRDYYRQRLENKTSYIYEAKLLIIGEGGVGKTSLVNKLINHNYTLKLEGSSTPKSSTEGIDVHCLYFDHPSGNPFRINIWDFGGQEIFHATHQFFLTKRSVYILVADTRQDNTDFNYWLEVIELFGEASPVLIVKNEKQERPCQVNENQLRVRFPNLEKILPTNLATNRGLSDIHAAIQHHISQLPHIGTPLPKAWVNVRKALETDPRNHISQNEFLTLCDTYGFKRHQDKLQLSSYLHDLGVCLHFQDDPILRNLVILNPIWGTTAVYKALDTPKVRANLGCFTQADLSTTWADAQYADMHDELLQLMMRFKLCYEIPYRPKTYIAPQLLSPNQPVYNWDDTNNLILRYQYAFMPKGMLTRFIVEMHKLIDGDLIWTEGIILKDENARAEVIEAYYKNEIRIRIAGKLKKPLLENIRHEFRKIHDSYNKPKDPPEKHRLRYQEFVPCNCSVCKGSQTPFSYSLDRLQERLKNDRRQIECDISYEMIDVRSLIDDVLRGGSSTPSTEADMKIFVSYSHADSEWLTKLQTHLKPLTRNQTIDLWDDTRIRPGDEWQTEIETALAAAKIAILLVSPNFIASDFIADNELPPLLDAAKAKGVTILWIPISHSSYKEMDFSKYQAAHDPKHPLNSLSNHEQDRVLVQICQEIKRIVTASG
jgi:internalin A